MREQDKEGRGKPVELRVYSPREAVKEIYTKLAANRVWVATLQPQWTSFDSVDCTIAHGTGATGHSASLDCVGIARYGTNGTDIIAYGLIQDPHLVSNKGDTLVFAMIGETPKIPERKDFLKKIIGSVAFDYETPDLRQGSGTDLAGLKFGEGWFGQNHEIRGVFVSDSRLISPRGMNSAQRLSGSILINSSLINALIKEIEEIRASVRF